MRLKGSIEARQRAKEQRKTMSPAEIALWRELRKKPGGMHFRKQHAAGRYDLDFYCAKANVAIEVDGAFHDRGDPPARDAVRDAWVAEQGVRTLRVPTRAVFEDVEGVIDWLVSQIASGLPPPSRG
jgi:very-short-patch-repair endonuclease